MKKSSPKKRFDKERHSHVLKVCGLANDQCVDAPKTKGFDVYGEQYCPYTRNAVKFLQQHNKTVRFHALGSARQEFAELYAKSHRTIPMVFREGRFVGGFDDLQLSFAQQK